MEFSSIEISSKAYLCKFILFGLEQKLVSFPLFAKKLHPWIDWFKSSLYIEE